ncbi:MAG: type II CAAX prenyl endopeptidase Rce1 family protein, partial [Salinirussus sp.]
MTLGHGPAFFRPANRHCVGLPSGLQTALALFLLATVVIASAGWSVSGLVDGPLGNAWATLLQAAVFLVLTGVVAGIGWFVDRRRIADLGLSLDGSWYREAGVGFGVGLAMATTVVGIGLATGVATVAGTFQIRSGVALPAPGTGVVLATLLYVPFFLGVGILEEVILRGYLLTNVAEGLRTILDDRAAVVAAVCATALLFGVLHAANPGGTALGVVNVGLAGLLLGGAYALTGRLALPVGV